MNATERLSGSRTSEAKWLPWVVWLLRAAVGAVFIVSGLAKAIDLWGTVYKFEEYFTAWNMAVPMPLTVLAAMALSSAEFLLGALLALGCFRRTVVWALLAVMCVMLPLSVYIWWLDPVPDCGCFGDFLIISNRATMLKNIVIVAALVFLAVTNGMVRYLYHPYSQWLCGVASLVFVTIVELYGFNIQPMVDFRSFPVGTNLAAVSGDELEEPEAEFEFIYEKDGHRSSFTADSLPDSTWTFVDRKEIGAAMDDNSDSVTELNVYDADDENVTYDVIAGEGLEMLVVVPQYERADMYYTSFMNELNGMMTKMGGSLVAISDLPADSIDSVIGDSMAEFPLYRAESTTLKELSRGVVSVVLLRDGVIQWKRNLSSIDVESLVESDSPETDLAKLAPAGKPLLERWAIYLLICFAALLAIDKLLCALIIRRKNGEAENKCVNLQKESEKTSTDETKEDESSMKSPKN